MSRSAALATRVKAGRQQVLNLLVSTFENAVEKNQELVRTNEELTVAKEQLTRWNEELETLNHRLDSANQRMTRDLDAAAKVQQSLLPTSNPSTSRVNFSWQYIPCDELAGDFLNYFALDDDHIALYVVDVSGHGVASSLLSVTIGRLMTPLVSASSLLVQADGAGGTRIVPPSRGRLRTESPVSNGRTKRAVLHDAVRRAEAQHAGVSIRVGRSRSGRARSHRASRPKCWKAATWQSAGSKTWSTTKKS